MRKLLLLFLISTFLGACKSDSDIKPANYQSNRVVSLSLLQKIKQSGELVVVTRNGPTTYYIDNSESPRGLEYDLATLLAKNLGVKLRIITVDNFSQAIPLLAQGQAHIAAAGIAITQDRKKLVKFGYPYQFTTQSVIYNRSNPRPRSLSDLSNGNFKVAADSSYQEHLHKLQQKNPKLRWYESYSNSSVLLSYVNNKAIDYTVAGSNELIVLQRSYPELRKAFTISDSVPLAWAFEKNQDPSLYDAANRFFASIAESGKLDELLERYYGHIQKFNYNTAAKFLEYRQSRLSKYEPWFRHAAKQYQLDWNLLAAIGYQESLWNPKAVSPTGVRGMMMLTRITAKEVEVKNRRDPRQSIYGGARYYKYLHDSLPQSINEPDRTWMALAAYNVGYGHLMDARNLSSKRGANPDKWFDVRDTLPLLEDPKWYKLTKYGYARGNEPVHYVENIRRFHHTLTWLNQSKVSVALAEAQANDIN